MEKIDANSVDDCTDESVMEFLETTQESDASFTAEFVKAEVLAKVTFSVSEKDPALRIMKAVADNYSLHRNLKLDFIKSKPKKAVEHLVSVIKPATLNALIESKLEMHMSELKKDSLNALIESKLEMHMSELKKDSLKALIESKLEMHMSELKKDSLKALIESKLEMDMSELKKDSLKALIKNKLEMDMCYALLRMRPLSISWRNVLL
jgi:hypothetical protein